ncbi:MAG: hypothetical protein U0791_01930 [Gemmataceae bacterium]
MYRKAIFAAGAALVMLAFDAAPAGAWAARHVGYTRVTPYGVQHAGRTTVATPYGARTTGSAYHAGYGGYSGYRYGYGGYRAPLPPVRPVVPVAPVGGVYGAGVYRRY